MTDRKFGPHYNDGRGHIVKLNEPIRLPPAQPRPVIGIRPLAIGAAYSDIFEFLAPTDWDAYKCMVELYDALPLAAAGWTSAMALEKLGEGRWKAVRGT